MMLPIWGYGLNQHYTSTALLRFKKKLMQPPWACLGLVHWLRTTPRLTFRACLCSTLSTPRGFHRFLTPCAHFVYAGGAGEGPLQGLSPPIDYDRVHALKTLACKVVRLKVFSRPALQQRGEIFSRLQPLNMLNLTQHQRGLRAAPSPRTVHVGPVLTPRPSAATEHRSKSSVVAHNNWRVFGPTNSYSDGDAEYFATTNRLAQQYEWFAPGPDAQEEEQPSTSSAPEDQRLERPGTRSTWGLSEKQIAALGLSGPQLSTPDPVSL